MHAKSDEADELLCALATFSPQIARVVMGIRQLLLLFALGGLAGATPVPCDSTSEERKRITESALHALQDDGRFYVLEVSQVTCGEHIF